MLREEIFKFDLIRYFILCHDFNVKINVLSCLRIWSDPINDTFFYDYFKIQAKNMKKIKLCVILRKNADTTLKLNDVRYDYTNFLTKELIEPNLSTEQSRCYWRQRG